MSSWSPVFGIKSQITKFQSSHVCNSHFSSGIDYHPQYTGYRPGTRIKQERKVFLWTLIYRLLAGWCRALGFSSSVSDGGFNTSTRPDHLRSYGERQWSSHDLVHPHHPLAAAGRAGHRWDLLQQELPTPCHKTFWDLDGKQVSMKSITKIQKASHCCESLSDNKCRLKAERQLKFNRRPLYFWSSPIKVEAGVVS